MKPEEFFELSQLASSLTSIVAHSDRGVHFLEQLVRHDAVLHNKGHEVSLFCNVVCCPATAPSCTLGHFGGDSLDRLE